MLLTVNSFNSRSTFKTRTMSKTQFTFPSTSESTCTLTEEDLSPYRIVCQTVHCPSHKKTLSKPSNLDADMNMDADTKVTTFIQAS